MAKDNCKNCGEPTNFGNSIGDRERAGWCSACWKMRDRRMRVRGDGSVYWTEPPGLHDRHHYDSRAPRGDDGE